MPASDDRKGAAPPVPGPGTTLVPPAGGPGVAPAVRHLLGGRYEVRGALGRGGMGEVWLARDVKLQVDVALKVVRPDRLSDEGALERLRAEVRSARAVASPHVCRVYDLVEAEDLECVSMEYVDGTTLRQLLDARSPLTLAEAREIALQLLAGLGAIHEAGLVHRDVKPENVMRTRAGRVVLMDFGIAKAVASGGTVAGTPAYWAPEQAAGAAADPRADVFATGIVLAEMVAPGGARDLDARRALWQGLREDPPQVPDTPWSEAIRRAIASNPPERYPSAQALARALEEIAHRVTGIEEAQPYPGLAAFTEAEAEYFFGREAEVEEVWKKLPGRHLLAVVGPSGAGKSSFLRAGLIPAKPEGWAYLICTPGDAPFVALGQALVPEVSHDTHAMRQMLRFEDADVAVGLFRRWRADHSEALVIVDQLEELFTLNPPDVQARFASLLSRLVLEVDVHVLLAMRDDFLLRCHEHEALRPIFEGLVPLGAPTGDALRRALVQPALKCGYRFEDEALVGEMLQAVEGERGALPLLAFAAASLWERRDRTQGLLTRSSYEAIGGVGGALAQHAEATLEKVGTDKLPLVRELFRNLVTAEGTRAVRDIAELLTVFPESQRPDADMVLRALIDARLLTSYEAHATEPGQTAGRRVEVVHESLLTAWPRLVRWRTEDEGSAQLRDQLRQAARLWEEKGRPDDLLWTGTSYQEYQVWRARYPGGLSEVEEIFARAMVARAGHRRRVRRMAVAAGFAAIVLVASGLGILLHRSMQETAQREAAQLLALGRLRLADHPNAALAYAIASLERSDNDPARRFAAQALWQGKPALFLTDKVVSGWFAWSPGGERFAVCGNSGLAVVDRDTLEQRQLSSAGHKYVRFTSDGRHLLTLPMKTPGTCEVWVLPEGRLERSLKLGLSVQGPFDDHLLVFEFDRTVPQPGRVALVRRVNLDGSTERVLGRWVARGPMAWDVDPGGRWIVYSVLPEHGHLFEQRLDDLSAPAREIGSLEGGFANPWGDRVVSNNEHGEVRIWDVATARLERTLKSPADARFIGLDPKGRFIATAPAMAMPPGSLVLFDLAAQRSAEPTPLLPGEYTQINSLGFSPDGSWLGTNHDGLTILWNMRGARSIVLGHHEPPSVAVAFTPDGHLLSSSDGGVLRRWALDPASGEGVRVLWSEADVWIGGRLEVDRQGRFVVVAQVNRAKVLVVPLDGSRISTYQSQAPPGVTNNWNSYPTVDPSGRFIATSFFSVGHPELNSIRVRDLVTGAERTLDTHPKQGESTWGRQASQNEGGAVAAWLPDGRLVTDGDAGLRVWDLASGTSRLLRSAGRASTGMFVLLASEDGRSIVRLVGAMQTGDTSSLSVFDLASGATREVRSHGNRLTSCALDATGTILVTADQVGIVRVGPLTGEEPHLLFGHTRQVTSVAISPDERWIASGSDDGTIRLWPMPDLSNPPLHTLPHDELVATLHALTNLRAARDPASDTGWKIEIGPFPGWATVPTWQP
jgi:eukaryotic-like serine/threonine-protein kinase